MSYPAARATTIAVDIDTRPAALALDELRRAWLGQLDELIATARELAVADDAYEFVKRPNIPYVYAPYDPEQLAAERIDTVLIINLRRKPLFWRRVNQGQNRGFPAAARHLIEKIRDAGISIALDGFDAAHSNLRLLSILPISKLRVAPYLFLRVGDGPSETRLFDGIMGAARGLGITVCATGIDSPELLSAVLQHGRPLAQGSALGPILSGAEFLEFLRGSNVDTAMLPPVDFGDEALQPAMR
jgi:EAL domain-containing protein/CHASE4 domain-containing protein